MVKCTFGEHKRISETLKEMYVQTDLAIKTTYYWSMEIKHDYILTLNLLKRKFIIIVYFLLGNYVTLHTYTQNHKM